MTDKKEIVKLIIERDKSQGLIAVQAQKEIILEAINQGASIKAIHTVLQEKKLIPIQYSSFASLVKKYLLIKKEQPLKTEIVSKNRYAYNPDLENIDDLK